MKYVLLAIFAVSAAAQTVEPTVTHIRTDKGLVITRFADKQYVDSPIALSMDKTGALFVAEARRFHRGVEDTRSKSFWMMDELAIQSTADRLAQYEKWTAAGKFTPDHFTNTADRIVKIRDFDGDGTADTRSVFASFNEPLDGNGASVLVRAGKVYYTNIPHLWLLEDPDQDGIAESRTSLQDGFGLRSGVNGHDMHGLEWGPDGKLYWSIGDRGYNFVSKEGTHFKDTESGAVFRCDPDGSNIEIFARGGRNPQDLAFDAYGNLFTVDNNQGGGDRSRVCYIVEGGDYGWNSGCTNTMTFRSASGLGSLAGPRITHPYMAEGLWKQAFPEQPAHVIPAVDFIDGGSAGLTYIPGASLGNHYPQHFAFCALGRGLKTFAFSAEGAGFRMVDTHDFWKGGSPIDAEFGPDGELYVADYARSGGNIFVLRNPQALHRPSVIEAATILRKSIADFANERLYELLAQRDQRVRLQAQFELAARGASEFLIKAATTRVPEVLDAPVEVDPEPEPEPESETLRAIIDRGLGPWASLRMGSPSATDAAHGATVTWVDDPALAKPHAKAGAKAGADGPRLPRLTDGIAAADDDDISACSWLDSKPSRLIMDLGAPTDIGQVHSYSWHKGDRAPQNFSLYGAINVGDWQPLGSVDTRPLGAGGKHGSIVGDGSSMGQFRYLMWHAFTDGTGCFFTEFDVYRPGEFLQDPVAITQRVDDNDLWDSLAIGPPSSADFATQATVTYAEDADFATPHAQAGADGPYLPRLNDGEAAANNDDVTRCAWLDNKPYEILMDLGSVQPVSQVHTYSWHRANRSPQRFTLLGSADAESWTEIAKVDTSTWGDGGKHASVIRREGGDLGEFRHLKWKVDSKGVGTFFTELDVYTADQTAPEIGKITEPEREPAVAFEPFNGPLLRRLHGIWGLGQLGLSEPLIPLLRDPSFHVRAQSARILGDLCAGGPSLLPLLDDESPRVQYFAAISLGKIRHEPAIPALIELLARNDNADPYLRHAAIFGLEGIGDLAPITHESPAVRLASLVLLRRAGDARIAHFLSDPGPRIVREAIAAINDTRIAGAEPALGEHLASYLQPDVQIPSTLSFDRMINAAFRQGHLDTLLAIGAAEHLPDRVRSAALFRLERWTDPYPVDPTLGQLRDYPADRSSDTSPIPSAIRALIPTAKGDVLSACYHLAAIYDIHLDTASLRRQIHSTTDRMQRLQALNSILQNPPADLAPFLEALIADKDPFLRTAALQALAARAPITAEPHLIRFAEQGSSLERQAAYKALGSLKTDHAAQLLIDGMGELLADSANHPAALELLEACSQRGEPQIQRLLAAYRDTLPSDDPLADYRAAIAGGHPKTGETTVREHGTAACIICHSIKGKGGVVAPDLSKIGPRASGEYLLESLITPNAQVIPGFGAEGISTMPPMHGILKKHEIRDIIAYLRKLNQTEHVPRVCEVRNAGVGGHTSADLLGRLQRDVLDHHPSTVVLMVGTNDRLNSRKLIPADAYRANLATLITAIRTAGAKVLLVTPPPCIPDVLFTRHDPAAYADQAPNARLAEIREIMLATGQPIVDFQDPSHLSKDGVHLTPAGYAALAEAVAAGLSEHALPTRRVICFGDSLTAGPYPGELRKILSGYSIGLSMYSLRQLFADGTLSALDYPAFARETFGITEIDIWDGALPADRRADPEMYRELRKSAESAGCSIFLLMAGSVNAAKPDDAKRFFQPVENAVLLGADYLRIFLRAPEGERAAGITQCIDVLRPLADFAKEKGITLVIEPGSSKTTEDGSFLAELAAQMQHPALALMPDFGKLRTDPYGGTEAMLPHSPVISAKSHNFDSDGEEQDLDYPRLLKSINTAKFRGIIAIEYEGKKLSPVDGVRATQRLLERLRP